MARRTVAQSPDCSPVGWALMNEPWEVLPFNDVHQHVSGVECWCRPRIDDDEVIVHNAADCREDYVERGRKTH